MVLPGGHVVLGRAAGRRSVGTDDRGVDPNRSRLGRVQPDSELENRLVGYGREAQEAGRPDGNRSSGVDGHWSPDASRGAGGRQWAALEGSGHAPLRPARRSTRHRDGQGVLDLIGQQLGHVEPVRGEVDPEVAEVMTIEPDLGFGEHTVEAEPLALGPARWVVGEPSAIQDRAFAVGKRGVLAPMPGHGDRGPVAVVQVGIGTVALELG